MLTSYSDDKHGDVPKSRLNRLKKTMLGDRKFDRELIVTEEVEQYRSPPREEKQFSKMTKFNRRGVSEDGWNRTQQHNPMQNV